MSYGIAVLAYCGEIDGDIFHLEHGFSYKLLTFADENKENYEERNNLTTDNIRQ